jgi:NADH-quinone oxidoreductase subunit J
MIEIDFSTIAFFIFSLLALGGGFGVVTNRNLFRGTIWLMVSLFGVAGLFVLLSAPFLAAVQVLVYIGAIAILFTFAVMLTRSLTRLTVRYNRLWPSVIGSVLLFAMLVISVIWPVFGANDAFRAPASDVVRSTTDLGLALVAGEGYVLPFEVASLLLTAAMIGAIVIARDVDEEEISN